MVVQDEFANGIRELFALPATFDPAGAVTVAFGDGGALCLDRVGGGAELVRGNMRHHCRLAGRKCGVSSGAIQVSGRSHGMTTRRAGRRHRDLAVRPGTNLFDRVTRPGIRGPLEFEPAQHMFSTYRRPPGQQPMVGVRECPPATDGDEPWVAIFGQNHGDGVPERTSPP